MFLETDYFILGLSVTDYASILLKLFVNILDNNNGQTTTKTYAKLSWNVYILFYKNFQITNITILF